MLVAKRSLDDQAGAMMPLAKVPRMDVPMQGMAHNPFSQAPLTFNSTMINQAGPPRLGGGVKVKGGAYTKNRQRTAQGRQMMKTIMKFILHEVDKNTGQFIVGHQGPLQFLDVCCSPGGFSEYTLDANKGARGIGLSLPVELGGHVPAINLDAYKDRYLLKFVDVTTVCHSLMCSQLEQDMAPQDCLSLTTDPVTPMSLPPGNVCGVVILDGSFLGFKEHIHKETELRDEDNPAFNVYCNVSAAHQALLAAQVAIMVRNLKEGGSLLIRLNMTPDPFMTSLLCLLRRMFKGKMLGYKPRSCHVHQTSYYLTCHGFDAAIAKELQVSSRLSALVATLRSKGNPAFRVPIPEVPEGTDRLEDFWGPSLVHYHMPLWEFKKLVNQADELFKAQGLAGLHSKEERLGRFAQPCIEKLLGEWSDGRFGGCREGDGCRRGHCLEELHPLVRQAYKQRNSEFLYPHELPETEGSQLEKLAWRVWRRAGPDGRVPQPEARPKMLPMGPMAGPMGPMMGPMGGAMLPPQMAFLQQQHGGANMFAVMMGQAMGMELTEVMAGWGGDARMQMQQAAMAKRAMMMEMQQMRAMQMQMQMQARARMMQQHMMQQHMMQQQQQQQQQQGMHHISVPMQLQLQQQRLLTGATASGEVISPARSQAAGEEEEEALVEVEVEADDAFLHTAGMVWEPELPPSITKHQASTAAAATPATPAPVASDAAATATPAASTPASAPPEQQSPFAAASQAVTPSPDAAALPGSQAQQATPETPVPNASSGAAPAAAAVPGQVVVKTEGTPAVQTGPGLVSAAQGNTVATVDPEVIEIDMTGDGLMDMDDTTIIWATAGQGGLDESSGLGMDMGMGDVAGMGMGGFGGGRCKESYIMVAGYFRFGSSMQVILADDYSEDGIMSFYGE